MARPLPSLCTFAKEVIMVMLYPAFVCWSVFQSVYLSVSSFPQNC